MKGLARMDRVQAHFHNRNEKDEAETIFEESGVPIFSPAAGGF